MLQLRVDYQDSYSRLHLLLRLLFGGLYIVFPHFLVLFFVLIWAKLLWLYSTFFILLYGKYPEGAWKFSIGTMNWLSRVHLTTYNLRDDYPVFGVTKMVDYMRIEVPFNENPNRLSVLLRFLFGGVILLPQVFVWVFRNFASGVLSFLAFWAVLFTGKYPKPWFDFNVGTLRWLLRIMGYQMYLFENYPPFSGKDKKMDKDYISINKDSWNKRTEIHFDSSFYDNETFKKGRNSLNTIELDLLGDLTGKKVLHLQCHFGQDTISLERLGATVTGVDLSNVAIDKANALAKEVGSNARFICCDLYSLPEFLEEEFDIVFTSYGTIGWLPDINKWAQIVSKYLVTRGSFVFAEFHPMVWMFDDELKEVKYRYFNDDPIIELEGTYTDGAKSLETQNISWNHGLAEVFTALISNDLNIEKFKEFDYSPYNCFSNMIEIAPNKFINQNVQQKIPMVYSLLAKKG